MNKWAQKQAMILIEFEVRGQKSQRGSGKDIMRVMAVQRDPRGAYK